MAQKSSIRLEKRRGVSSALFGLTSGRTGETRIDILDLGSGQIAVEKGCDSLARLRDPVVAMCIIR